MKPGIFKYFAPTGSILPFVGDDIPDGWLLCNGAEVSREDYENLFGVIGTKFGEGDGETTFNLPDTSDKFLEGAGTYDVGDTIDAGAPEITGYTGHPVFAYNGGSFTNGCIYLEYSRDYLEATGSSHAAYYLRVYASKSNAIYSNSSTIQPESIIITYIIHV